MGDLGHNSTMTARHTLHKRLPELIDEKQASKLLGISLNTLRSWRNCGDGPDFYKLGTAKRSLVRYDVDVLAEWLRGHLRVQKARATAEEKHVAYRRGSTYHYRIRWNGQQYRGSCKTSKLSEAKKVESLVLAQLLENKQQPGSKKIPTLAEFSSRFFPWLDSLPTDRPPKEGTRKYYRVGWKLLEKTSLAGRRIDQIERDHIAYERFGEC